MGGRGRGRGPWAKARRELEKQGKRIRGFEIRPARYGQVPEYVDPPPSSVPRRYIQVNAVAGPSGYGAGGGGRDGM
jgi:hypothetical protein